MLNRNPFDQHRAARARAGEEAHEEAREVRGLRLLRTVRSPRGLTPEQVRRIASRLDGPVVPVRRPLLVPVLAGVALLLLAGTAAAWATGTLPRIPVVGALFRSPRVARRSPAPETARPPVRPSETAARKDQTPEGEPDVPDVPDVPEPDDAPASQPRGREDRPAPASSARPRRVNNPPAVLASRPDSVPTRPVPAARDSSTVPPTRDSPIAGERESSMVPLTRDSPIAREGESFAKVLRAWRRDHDDRAALAALDLHDRVFAAGQMALESRLLRVEILLADRRDREALALLDRLPLDQGNIPRSRELLTVRGELRIRAGRCDAGRADLASIGAGAGPLAERARNALTHCR